MYIVAAYPLKLNNIIDKNSIYLQISKHTLNKAFQARVLLTN